MPFQSEKQRRYLHANHPEIAKRWERDYANGGILDINESEEIIDDGGNEIELTDYNAAFDDPNDLSTGVKSLFQAKDGGTPRRRYFTGAYGGSGDKDEGPPGGGATSQGSGRDYSPAPSDRQPGFETSNTRTTTPGPGPDRHPESFPEPKLPPQLSGEGTVTDAIDLARQDFETKKAQLEKKLRNTFIKKILGAFLGGGLTIGLSDLKTAKTMYDLSQVQKDYINLLENAKTQYKKQGLPEFNPHVDTAIQTLDQEILDLTQKPDRDEERGGDGPVVPQVIPIGEEVQEYEQMTPDAGGTLASIRSRQALNAQLQAKWAAEQEAHDQLYMVANRGGLANLFRVKKQ